MRTLDLRWGSGRMMFGPSGPAVITVIGKNVTISDRSPELWVQPHALDDRAATPAEKLLEFTPTIIDANTVAMVCADVGPVNRVNARWVLALDGNPVAGGFATGSIEGSNDHLDSIVITEGQGTIELNVIDINLSGGGGVQSVVAGANVTVNATNPAKPVISAAVGVSDIPDMTHVVYDSDPALTDARTPTVHAASHGAGGSDPITVAQSQVSSLTSDLGNKADLVGGKIPSAQIPALAITETFVVSTQTAMLALVAQMGDVCVRTDTSQTFILSGSDPSQLSDWTVLVSPPAPVQSVNAQTGAVVLSASDVGARPSGSVPVGDVTGLATVATSGSYNDLSAKPTIPATAADVGAAPAVRPVGTGLGSSGTIDLDFAVLNDTIQTVTATGAVTFTTSNRAAGKAITLIVIASGADRAITWPAWRTVGAALPTTVKSGKALVVSLTCIDATLGNLIAAGTIEQ